MYDDAHSMTSLDGRASRLAICVPVYNDWVSASLLLSRLETVAASLQLPTDVIFVDDGSSEPIAPLSAALPGLNKVSIVRLRRNLGHQRAIAIGLAYLYADDTHDFVVVMDGDGEDDPSYLQALVDEARRTPQRAVFARRSRRSEGWFFRLGYVSYRLIHRVLVGRDILVGNYSVISRDVLARLVAVSELWNHYAAAVFHSRIPTALVPVPRATRLAGRTKMNLASLVTHGLSAISVYGDLVGVRVLLALAVSTASIVLLIVAVVAVRVLTDLAIPGWATTTVGLLVLLLVNLISVSLSTVLFTLRARMDSGFIPIRDYSYFVLDRVEWRRSSTEA